MIRQSDKSAWGSGARLAGSGAAGKRPYEDIDIVFTKVRPGEKLFEELFDCCEECTPTSHPRITTAQCPRTDTPEMERQIGEIRALVTAQDVPGLKAKFKSLVPGYQSRETAQPGPRRPGQEAAEAPDMVPALAAGQEISGN